MNDEELPARRNAAPLGGSQTRCIASQARVRAVSGSRERLGLIILFSLLTCSAVIFWVCTAVSRGSARWNCLMAAVGVSYWVLWISGLAALQRYRPARRNMMAACPAGPPSPVGRGAVLAWAERRLAGRALAGWPRRAGPAMSG